MVYGFGFISSKLGYAKVSYGAPSLLARLVWLFEDNERSILDLKLFFFRTLMDWLSTLQNQYFSSFLEVLDLCNFCT